MFGCRGQMLSILSVQLVLTTLIPRNTETKMHLFGIKVTGSSKSKNKTPQKIPPPLFGNDPSPQKKLKLAALMQGVGHAMPSG